MTQEDNTPSDEQADEQPYDALQGALETVEERYDPVEEAVEELQLDGSDEATAEQHLENFREHREEIDDAAERAEEQGEPTELSAAPARVDYLQGTLTALQSVVNIGDDLVDDLEDATEGVEDILEDIETGPDSLWYVRVSGVPLLYPDPEVPAERLVVDARDPDNPTNYVVKAWATEERSSLQGEFDPDEGDQVPLDEGITELTLERNAGGGQV